MLRFNLSVIFTKRNVSHPRRFLMETIKVNHVTASNLLSGSTKSLHLSYVSRLCEVLQCTPDELLEWVPSKNDSVLPEKHPLNKLTNRQEEKLLMEQALKKVGQMSAEELRAMMEAVAEKK